MKKIVISTLALLLLGCGDSKEGFTRNLDNAKLADGENTLGYFGKKVIFGETQLIGVWKRTVNNLTYNFNFTDDGTQIIEGGTFDGFTLDYGVSMNGEKLSNKNEIIYIIKKYSGDCYDIEVTTAGDLNTGIMCKNK